MSMKCVGGLNHKNKQRPTSYTNNTHSQVSGLRSQRANIRVWLHPYDL